jgi:hypothetical protein
MTIKPVSTAAIPGIFRPIDGRSMVVALLTLGYAVPTETLLRRDALSRQYVRRSMQANNEQRTSRSVAYLLLLGIQLFGTIIFIWQDLSEFEQLLLNPGEQLPEDIHSDLIIFGVFCMMQIAFWCRIL